MRVVLSPHLPTDGWWVTSSISRASFSGSKESASSPATLEMTQSASCRTRGGMYVFPSSDSSPDSITRTSWGRTWADNLSLTHHTKPSWTMSTRPHSDTTEHQQSAPSVSTSNLKFSKGTRDKGNRSTEMTVTETPRMGATLDLASRAKIKLKWSFLAKRTLGKVEPAGWEQHAQLLQSNFTQYLFKNTSFRLYLWYGKTIYKVPALVPN